MDLHLDWSAVDRKINEMMRKPVDEAAAQIAAKVDLGSVTEAQVGTMSSETSWGWPVALVTIMHPAGIAMEAKRGTLKRAAASVGLEVKSKT